MLRIVKQERWRSSARRCRRRLLGRRRRCRFGGGGGGGRGVAVDCELRLKREKAEKRGACTEWNMTLAQVVEGVG